MLKTNSDGMSRGIGLPIVLIVTLLMSAVAIWAASEFRDGRQEHMVDVAGEDLARMMDAVDKYRALYTTLPHRLTDLNKVGYRESGGMVVCLFSYIKGETPREDYLDIALKHRAADEGAWTQYPSGQRMIRLIAIPDCRNVRRRS